jgi:hypothetical protein
MQLAEKELTTTQVLMEIMQLLIRAQAAAEAAVQAVAVARVRLVS